MRVIEICVKRIRVNQGLGVGAQRPQIGPIAWPNYYAVTSFASHQPVFKLFILQIVSFIAQPWRLKVFSVLFSLFFFNCNKIMILKT